MNHQNDLGQPIGFPVKAWTEPPLPKREALFGVYGHLEPLELRHAEDLFRANSEDNSGAMWTYMPYGPFETLSGYKAWIERVHTEDDPLFYAITDTSGKALGVASYLRISPESGSIEVGHIAYSPPLQKTTLATEAMFLMMRRAFELGYRRYEWKCDATNTASRKAAQRLGFSFEGIFRQATLYKGRNRDTAWFAVIDKDWPRLKNAFERWLKDDNFEEGEQKKRLSTLTLPYHNDTPS